MVKKSEQNQQAIPDSCPVTRNDRTAILKILSNYMDEEKLADPSSQELFNQIAQLVITDKSEPLSADQVAYFSEQCQQLSELCLDFSGYFLIKAAEIRSTKANLNEEE